MLSSMKSITKQLFGVCKVNVIIRKFLEKTGCNGKNLPAAALGGHIKWFRGPEVPHPRLCLSADCKLPVLLVDYKIYIPWFINKHKPHGPVCHTTNCSSATLGTRVKGVRLCRPLGSACFLSRRSTDWWPLWTTRIGAISKLFFRDPEISVNRYIYENVYLSFKTNLLIHLPSPLTGQGAERSSYI